MKKSQSQISYLKHQALIKLIQAFYGDNFGENVRRIPFEIIPKTGTPLYRCCIYKERAILRERTIAGLGFSIEEDDELKHLSSYAKEALERQVVNDSVLTVINTGCQGCEPSKIYVTDLCQGCVSRPCISSCNFDAIKVVNGRSVIDKDKCVKCTKCIGACPYNAVIKTTIPCEGSCPVDAIKKNPDDIAEIDFEKCISCGACISHCPFGAVHEISQIIDVLKKLGGDKKVVAMIAPSIMGQFECSLEELVGAFLKAGFDEVVEVAEGADLTALHEAHDFRERMANGDNFMTTSCCAAYNELAEKHLPAIKPFMSETPTPLFFTAELTKQNNPDCITIFVGPCVAKRKEGMSNKNVDYVVSFEEISALFIALNINPEECEPISFKKNASAQGRSFGVTSGVSKAVIAASGHNKEIKPALINGLNKQVVKQLSSWAKNGSCPEGNLVEVMGCVGGCIGGSCVIASQKTASKKIKEVSANSEDIKPINS